MFLINPQLSFCPNNPCPAGKDLDSQGAGPQGLGLGDSNLSPSPLFLAARTSSCWGGYSSFLEFSTLWELSGRRRHTLLYSSSEGLSGFWLAAMGLGMGVSEDGG